MASASGAPHAVIVPSRSETARVWDSTLTLALNPAGRATTVARTIGLATSSWTRGSFLDLFQGGTMGTLIYGNAGFSVEFDDRTLVHLQLVIGPKLRRQESFFFSWGGAANSPHARTSLWMDRSVPMVFLCTGDERFEINRTWLELLSTSANSAQGLQLVVEPAAIGND
jgi:hypothetical protein